MRMRVSVISATLLLLTMGTASATELPARDLLASGYQLDGRQVTLRDCTIVGANPELVSCTTQNSSMTHGIVLETDTLDSVDLGNALKRCSSWSAAQTCAADISGVVTVTASYYRLAYAGIIWKNPQTQK